MWGGGLLNKKMKGDCIIMSNYEVRLEVYLYADAVYQDYKESNVDYQVCYSKLEKFVQLCLTDHERIYIYHVMSAILSDELRR